MSSHKFSTVRCLWTFASLGDAPFADGMQGCGYLQGMSDGVYWWRISAAPLRLCNLKHIPRLVSLPLPIRLRCKSRCMLKIFGCQSMVRWHARERYQLKKSSTETHGKPVPIVYPGVYPIHPDQKHPEIGAAAVSPRWLGDRYFELMTSGALFLSARLLSSCQNVPSLLVGI